MEGVYRILDANTNRAVEGIRVIEDLARFSLNHTSLMENCRGARHFLRKSFAPIIGQHIQIRDSQQDVGKVVSQQSFLDKKSTIHDVATANCKRVTEALRVVEEYTKVVGHYELAKEVEEKRYQFYTIEKEILVLLPPERPPLPTGLYGITGEQFTQGRGNIVAVKEMIAGGIRIVQYREKSKPLGEMYHEAKQIAKLCKESGVTFIVNDYIDIALLVDADGVHLGQDDIPVGDARKLLGPHKLIGLSTHGVEDALAAEQFAEQRLIDYIGAGPIFPTTTKDRPSVGLEYLDWVSKHVTIPYVAIGGIKLHNIDQVMEYKPKHVSLVSEILGSEHIAAITEKIQKYIEKESVL